MAQAEGRASNGFPAQKYLESKRSILLRTFSQSANMAVKGQVGDAVSPGMAVIFVFNSLSGVSLLILPYGFYQTGVVLGVVIVLVCMLFAYITATFMMEALTIANALNFEQAVRKNIVDNPELAQSLNRQRMSSIEPGHEEPLVQKCVTQDEFIEEVRQHNPDREFKIRERVELGAMGEAALSGSVLGLMATRGIYLIILSAGYGVLAAMVVSVSQSLANTAPVLTEAVGVSLDPDFAYRPCVLLTFFITLPLCFADLQKTKKFTLVLMALRCLAIIFMLAASTQRAVERWQQLGSDVVLRQLPLWKPEEFMAVFGNAVCLFALHHYIPSFVAPLQNQTQAPRVISTAFILSFTVGSAIGVAGVLAFGAESAPRCEAGSGFCKVQPLFNLNFVSLDWAGGAVGTFVVMYPALAIASIPIVAITARNTWNQVFGWSPPSANNPYTASNILVVLSVLVPTFVFAALTKDIQAVMKYVGAYFALTLAYLCPVVMVVGLRHKLHLDLPPDAYLRRPLKSPLANIAGYAIVVGFWGLSISLSTKTLFFS